MMKRFLELHYDDGDPVMIGMSHILCVDKTESGKALIVLVFSPVSGHSTSLEVAESYLTVRQMIADAQGGMPINPERQRFNWDFPLDKIEKL